MNVEFLEHAFEEYKETIEFYNLQSEGLGIKYRDEVDKAISIIKNYPESFTQYTQHTRKAVVNIFPYNIHYSFRDNRIVVIAIAHQHRKPNYWEKDSALLIKILLFDNILLNSSYVIVLMSKNLPCLYNQESI